MARTSRLLTALLLASGTFGLLLAGTGAAEASKGSDSMDGVFAIAPSRPGDHTTYSLHLVAMEDTRGGWAYDANARLVVERLGDRVLPVDGQPQVVSSFSSTWNTGELDWGIWSDEWGMTEEDWEKYEEDWEEYEEEWDEWEEEMDEYEEEYEEDCEEDPEDCEWDPDYDWSDAPQSPDFDFDFSFGFFDSDRVVGEPWHVAHADASHRVVATTRAETGRDLPGRRLAQDLGIETNSTILTLFGPSSAPCGFHSDLQDAAMALSEPVRVHGTCPPAGGHFGTPPGNVTSDRYVALGNDVVQGRPTVVFGHQGDNDALRLWFAADVPYPVRMLVPVVLYGDYETYLLFEMTEFKPGTLQGAAAAPPPLLSARLPTGPDDVGSGNDFPLSLALEAARIDLQHAGVRDFLATHPDAAIDEATFVRLRDGDILHDRWTFTLVSGPDALHVTATKGPPETPVPLSAVPGGIPPVPQAVAAVVPDDAYDGVEVTSVEASSTGRVAPAQMPQELPRVADLLALWRSDGAGGGVPAWAFHLTPDGSSWIAVGHAESVTVRSNPNNPASTEDQLTYSFYGVGPDGSFRFVEEYPARYEVPETIDPSQDEGGYDPQGDSEWSDPDGFALSSLGYWTLPETRTTATVSAAATLVGLLAYALWPAKFGIGLFSRIGSDQVLEHPMRSQIAQLVEAEPGIHFQEIVRRLDAGRGTTEHHLRKLLSANVVTAQVAQGFTCYFPKGKVDRHLMAAAPVLKSDGARQVLQCVQEQPGRSALDVSGATGLTPSTVNYHLKRLLASGLVSHERRGRFLLLTPTPLGTQALGAWGRT